MISFAPKSWLIALFCWPLLPGIPEPQPVPVSTCIHAEEQKLYTLIMEYRRSKGLEAIPLSARLTQVAQVHARDLSENHDASDDHCNLHSWSRKGKWKPCCYTPNHKKAACMWNKPREIAGYESNGYEIAYYNKAGATAEEGLAGWKQSAGHNKVIINDDIWKKLKWNAIGIGIYKEYGVVWFGEATDDTPISTCD